MNHTAFQNMTPVAEGTAADALPSLANYPGFFFITGSHRSGTSWITWLLNSHPEVFATMEAYFWGKGSTASDWLNSSKFLEWATTEEARHAWTRGIEPDKLVAAAKRAIVESVMRQQWRPGIRMIGDKTPVQYLVNARELHDMFPEAVLICCVRDGRDMAVSLAFHQLSHEYKPAYRDPAEFEQRHAYWIHGKGTQCPLFTPETLAAYSGEWEWCAQKAREANDIFGDRFVPVKYEDMLSNPIETLRSVLMKLGVDASVETVRSCVDINAFEKLTGRPRGAAVSWEFVRKGISGDWKNYFTERDISQFKASGAGRWLLELGYEASPSW